MIAIDNAEDIIPLGKVLAENGLPAAEITFRSEAAVEAIPVYCNHNQSMRWSAQALH